MSVEHKSQCDVPNAGKCSIPWCNCRCHLKEQNGAYAIVGRYRNHPSHELTVRHVYTGFASRAEAEAYNDVNFPAPEYNVIVPWSST